MIIVTGATGHLGRAIVEKLVERVPANQVGASVRDLEKAADLEALGVRVRQGDFDDPESLRHAFEGAAQVLIVSSNAQAYGGDPLTQHRSAIEAARATGAGRIVYTSHMAASDSSAFPPMLDHNATEAMLRQSGLAWTALRNGFYAASGIALMGDALETGVLEAPVDGKVSWTAHADLAEAAAIILANEGRYNGPTPPLTGSQSLDLADLAGIASELLDRPVRRQTLPDEDLRARMAARGPDRAADMVLGLYVASREGEFAPVDPTLERLLGRRPISMRDLIAEKVNS
ncbi:MAG: NAD(P)H-binding protein [Gemmatimonadaceae bacterium]|nr:NAD(P)H-binding protein [Gloeobacterales cyanobacterium ES-bin-141]